MAQRKIRICSKCNKSELTFSRTAVCSSCQIEIKKEDAINIERAYICNLKYENIEFVGNDNHGHRLWKFTAPCCNTEQTWVFGNILKRIKLDKVNLPCSNCGSKRRTKFALDGYLKLNARSYDLAQYEDYLLKVRRLSDKNYKNNLQTINPNNVVRSMYNYHLDHKVPIIVCFLENLKPEIAASVKNLQMLNSTENWSKGKHYFDLDILNELKSLKEDLCQV